MKSILACIVFVVVITAPALADSVGVINQGLASSTTDGGITILSEINAFTFAGVTLPTNGSLLFTTGVFGSLSGGGTFSSGTFLLDIDGAVIFATNFSGNWIKRTDNLYELVGTFSSLVQGIHGSTKQFFEIQFDNGVACLRDVNGSTTISTVPEPGSLSLLGTGLIGLAGAARRKLRIGCSSAVLGRFLQSSANRQVSESGIS